MCGDCTYIIIIRQYTMSDYIPTQDYSALLHELKQIDILYYIGDVMLYLELYHIPSSIYNITTTQQIYSREIDRLRHEYQELDHCISIDLSLYIKKILQIKYECTKAYCEFRYEWLSFIYVVYNNSDDTSLDVHQDSFIKKAEVINTVNSQAYMVFIKTLDEWIDFCSSYYTDGLIRDFNAAQEQSTLDMILSNQTDQNNRYWIAEPSSYYIHLLLDASHKHSIALVDLIQAFSYKCALDRNPNYIK